MKVDCSRVTHPFATAFISACASIKTVRLACLNHAASVHSEPGSNSPKRVQNLVIHELLYSASTEADARCLTEVRTPFLNFDWGSQSIAQSKFQRASSKRKENHQNFFQIVRQHIFQIFFEKVSKELKPNLPFAWPATDLFGGKLRVGRGNMRLREFGSSLFLEIFTLIY